MSSKISRFLAAVAAIALPSVATAAPVVLMPGTPAYSYDILAAGGAQDPNATLTGTMHPTADASYYNSGTSGALLTLSMSALVERISTSMNTTYTPSEAQVRSSRNTASMAERR